MELSALSFGVVFIRCSFTVIKCHEKRNFGIRGFIKFSEFIVEYSFEHLHHSINFCWYILYYVTNTSVFLSIRHLLIKWQQLFKIVTPKFCQLVKLCVAFSLGIIVMMPWTARFAILLNKLDIRLYNNVVFFLLEI